MNFLEPAPTWLDWNFRLLGAPVRVSGWFWILPGVIGAVCAWFCGPACYFVAVACFFASILLHEMGHVLTGRCFGADGYAVLNGIGGIAVGCDEVDGPWRRITVYVAGPLAQLSVGVPIFLTFQPIIASLNLFAFYSNALLVGLLVLGALNFTCALFNLLPIWPMDGYRICRELIALIRSRSRPPWEQDANWWKRGGLASGRPSYSSLLAERPAPPGWVVRWVVALAVGVPAVWLAWDLYRTWQRHQAYTELEKIGAVAGGWGPDHCDGFSFESAKVDDSHLALLEVFDRLDDVDLSGTPVTDNGLRHLEGLRGLQMLYLKNTRVTDAGLSHLEGLTELQVLHLSGAPITDAGLVHLRSMRKLEWLSLSHTHITDAGLSEIRNLPALKYVHVYDSQVTEEGLAELRKAAPSLAVNPTDKDHDDGCHYTNRADLKRRTDEPARQDVGNELK